MSDRIFIFCDDPSHAPKREPVDVFVSRGDGEWFERPVKKRVGRAGHVGTGMHMLGDEVARTGWATREVDAPIRTRHELICTKTPACRRRPVPATQEHLFAVLNHWCDTGADEIALAVLAAMLGEQAERDPG